MPTDRKWSVLFTVGVGTFMTALDSSVANMVLPVILAVGLWVLSRLGADSPLSHVTIGLVIVGLGTGIFISPNNSALLGAAPAERLGIASGVLATARNVGMVLGVGLAGAILTTVQARSSDLASGTFAGLQAGFLVVAIAALLGMLTSAVRGKGKGKG